MYVDLSALSPIQAYATMTQVVVPRPIAWILSENANASFNLAPFSYFTAVSADPPTVVVSAGHKPTGGIKDTRRNLEARGDCVIHIAHGDLAEPVTASAATLPEGESELDALGLDTVTMEGSRLPRLADCRIAMACSWVETHEIGRQGVLYLRVHRIHVDDAIVGKDAKERAKVRPDLLEPLARLGGGEYWVDGRVISIARPD